jgi:hypothetical protein
MSSYAIVNIVAASMAAMTAIYSRRQGKLSRALKISLVAPLLSFPWLYFGITQKAWSHGDAGVVFMNVPLNELFLSFLMTFVNASIFLLTYSAIINEARRNPKPKNCTAEKKEDDPVG